MKTKAAEEMGKGVGALDQARSPDLPTNLDTLLEHSKLVYGNLQRPIRHESLIRSIPRYGKAGVGFKVTQ